MRNIPRYRPLRVVFWGTYDLSKPRTRILRDGLRDNDVEIFEIHADVWSQHADKSQIGNWAMALTLLRLIFSYPGLVWRYLRAPDHDLVFVPYLGQFDVLVLWLFARLKQKQVIWDMFLSLYDTVVNDRQMASRRSPAALILKAVEWLGCRAVACVVVDTQVHAKYIAKLFGLPAGRTAAVRVGAESDAFSRLSASPTHESPTKLLFYGQLIPLHGIETILQAAMSERGKQHTWNIIGKGQQSGLVDRLLACGHSSHITRQEWLSYDLLIEAIAQADICLGIFGASEKAASVVPNKVYQCLTAGRPVITRQSPAMTEVFPIPHNGLQLIPHSDPVALLDAIDAVRNYGFPVVPNQMVAFAQPKEIGRMLYNDVLAPVFDRN